MARLDDLLATCLAELDANGGDIKACLRRYPERAERLRPSLTLAVALHRSAPAAPAAAALSAGRQQLIQAAVTARNAAQENRGKWRNPLYRAATAIGGAILVGTAAVGIAGAAGAGGNFADNGLHTLHLSSPDEHATSGGGGSGWTNTDRQRGQPTPAGGSGGMEGGNGGGRPGTGAQGPVGHTNGPDAPNQQAAIDQADGANGQAAVDVTFTPTSPTVTPTSTPTEVESPGTPSNQAGIDQPAGAN